MKRLMIQFFILVLSTGTVLADTADEIRATYDRFAEAQNARDLDRIGAFFVDGPEFLWVSDGRSYWGREAVLARMAGFQKAEIWRVEPGLDASAVVELDDMTAMLHMPLTLVIGPSASPDHLPFLVTILFVRRDETWRIASLLTTTAK